MSRCLVTCMVCVALVVLSVGNAEAGKKPDIEKFEIVGPVQFEASEVWTDPMGYEQACGFDFLVQYDERFILHVYDDYEFYQILIRDTYVNLETGFAFEDFASYTIRFNYETGYADHKGLFWRIRIPGIGMVLLDVGQFVQDWYGGWVILADTLVGANHDVNGPISQGELPAVSYCDLMAQIFPEN